MDDRYICTFAVFINLRGKMYVMKQQQQQQQQQQIIIIEMNN